MTNILEKFENDQLATLTEGKEYPEFQAGDVVCVSVLIVEGKTERVQDFEGLCIARRNRGLNSSFTVRKLSHGEGVERVFPLYSPKVVSIKLVRRGVVRRAKLYYMRNLRGKAARIKEKRDNFVPKASKKTVAKEQKSPEAKKTDNAKQTESTATDKKADSKKED